MIYLFPYEMKVVFPQNIQKGIFAWLQISIGSFSISMIQMFTMAIGIVFALVVFSTCSKSDAKTAGIVFAIIIIIIFAVISFFKVSELNLLQFVGKKIKDNFLDTPVKKQENFIKDDPITLIIAKSHKQERKQKIELKNTINIKEIQKMEKWGIL